MSNSRSSCTLSYGATEWYVHGARGGHRISRNGSGWRLKFHRLHQCCEPPPAESTGRPRSPMGCDIRVMGTAQPPHSHLTATCVSMASEAQLASTLRQAVCAADSSERGPASRRPEPSRAETAAHTPCNGERVAPMATSTLVGHPRHAADRSHASHASLFHSLRLPPHGPTIRHSCRAHRLM
jgi:hypothetical protein